MVYGIDRFGRDTLRTGGENSSLSLSLSISLSLYIYI